MNRAIIRNFSVNSHIFKAPRFTQTLVEASKPPLEKPQVISRPFGLDTYQLINQRRGGLANFNIFSADAKEKRQKQLDHDIKHSPFYDSKSFNNTKGKIFTPPVSYFKGEKSKFFPDFIGNTLVATNQRFSDRLKDHVNVVRIYSTLSGERCADTYFKTNGKNYLTTDYDEFTTKFPNTHIIDINIPQNWLKGFFVNLSKGNIKKQIPLARQDCYFLIPDHVFTYNIKQELYCDNSCAGFIYLVDQEGRIRWATSGNANEKELTLMWKCLSGLEGEFVLEQST